VWAARAAVLALLAGCLSKPPRPDVDPVPDGGVVGCMASAFRDDFETGTEPCGVAFPDEAGTCVMKRSNGVLTMTPGPGDGNDCSCTSPDFLFADGIFVEVIDSTGQGDTYTIMQLTDPPVSISVIDGGTVELHMAVDGTVIAALPYNGTTQRWWRLRPEGGAIVGEFSETGTSWTHLATATVAPPMRTQVSLNSGSFGTVQPMTATFDNLGTCPP
jgi:hypothetical protein